MTDTHLTLNTLISRKEGLSAAKLDGETILLDTDTGAYYAYDAVGSRIWELIAVPQTVGQLCQALIRHYDVEAARCEREVIAFLGDLSSRGLVRVEASMPETPRS